MYFVCILYWRQGNILRNILAPTAAEIFHFHVYWLHILLWRQTIFSEMFQHQLLPKDFIFTSIQCTCSPGHKQYSLEYFALKSQSYFHMYWVRILLWRQNNIIQNILAPTAAENFHSQPTQCTCSQATNSIFWSISAPRAAKIFYFCVYQVHLLLQTLNNILWKFSAPTAALVFHFHMY